ncbi:hypothetical protein [Flavobacterium sp. WC2509]|uniref:hypothetical protein n=1 Tax=Flavobacterium sp. WC2509 TaxID=3461406 RepID=UPI004044FE88
MKVKLLITLSLFVCQFGFSQAREYLGGVVSSDEFLLQNVDVINKTSEKSTRTNENGEFLIVAKENDSIFFYSKNFYLKKIKVSKAQLEQNKLNVLMIVKPEELDEVVVERVQSLSFRGSKAYEQEKIDEYKTKKFDNNEGYQAMRRGTFVNGLNFAEVGKRLLRLLKKDKETIKEAPETEFAILAKNTCDQKFFTDSLKLKPEEIDLFLQFCDLDSRSKKLKENNNVLSMMDFLSAKNIEFQKLK